jgi:hypothetical protein
MVLRLWKLAFACTDARISYATPLDFTAQSVSRRSLGRWVEIRANRRGHRPQTRVKKFSSIRYAHPGSGQCTTK